MFIIFGIRNSPKLISRGRFVCPLCRRIQTYRRVRVTQHFHVFFIPLFPLESFGEFVQCTNCLGHWNPRVLEPTPLSPHDPIVKEVRKRLAQGTPTQALRQMLARRGMDSEKIDDLLGLAMTGQRAICTHCFRTCSSIERVCPDCGRELPPVPAIIDARPEEPARLRVEYAPPPRQNTEKGAAKDPGAGPHFVS